MRPAPTASPSAQPVVRAAIDCGANSVHLLVGVVEDHRVRPLADESTFLGLGAAAADGQLGATLVDHLVATIVSYVGVARGLGARDVVVVGTEPFRRAGDARQAFADIRTATGLRPAVISHNEEALLTLIGVTGGRRVEAGLLVCDVGGGSTELGMVGPRRRPAAYGIRAGSAVLTERLLRHDPPTAPELRALRAETERLVAAAPSVPPSRLVAVGGSATNLLRVLPIAALDMVLTRARLAEIGEVLATETAALTAQRHGVSVIRARLLPAGAAILDAIMARYGTDQIEVSELGIREGMILAASQPGGPWRRRLGRLAAGWGPALVD
jgi:exopolyphosphatase/guanosine-5'-triphosphate,3'-diphosphate pyrophosphatase